MTAYSELLESEAPLNVRGRRRRGGGPAAGAGSGKGPPGGGAAAAAGAGSGGPGHTDGKQPSMAAVFKLRFPGVFLLMISAMGRPRGMAGKVGQSSSV